MIKKYLTFGVMGLMFATSLPLPVAAQSNLSWSVDRSAKFAATLRVTRPNGKPRFVAWCGRNQKGIININILGNLSTIPNDGGVRVVAEGDKQTVKHSGHVQTLSNERNIFMQTNGKEKFWVTMASSNRVRFLVGGNRISVLRDIEVKKVKRFIKICSNQNTYAEFERKVNRQIAGPKPQQPAPQQPAKKDDDFSVAEGIALGILGIGAAIIGNEIAKDIFDDKQQPQQPARQPQQPAPNNNIQRTWGVGGSYDTITASDCNADCEEDKALLIACRGDGLPAIVDALGLGFENGRSGANETVYISVGQQVFSYAATINGPGLVGYWPSFFINPNDPIIEALQAGSSARMSIGNTVTDFGLRGSRSALNIFKAHCGWNNVPLGTEFADGYPVTPAQQPVNDAHWFASQYTENTSGKTFSTLSFGIPETDALGFYASCEVGGGNQSVRVDMQLDYGNLRVGSPVTSYVQASGQTFQYRGSVFQESSEWAGITMNIDSNDPVWRAMQDEPQNISYGMYGGGQNTTSSHDAATALGQFINNCQRFNGPSGPAQPSYGQQFSCNDRSNLTISFNEASGVSFANVRMQNGSEFALVKVPTPRGDKYSNGDATLNVNGQRVRLSTNNTTLFCQGN
ncbi:MAG: hypothetical protein AB8B94_00640 [Hyphomicrobiales bacterium]